MVSRSDPYVSGGVGWAFPIRPNRKFLNPGGAIGPPWHNMGPPLLGRGPMIATHNLYTQLLHLIPSLSLDMYRYTQCSHFKNQSQVVMSKLTTVQIGYCD